MPRPLTSQTPAQVSKSSHARRRHHHKPSVPPNLLRYCATGQVDEERLVSLPATQRGDTDLISEGLPSAVHLLSSLPRKSLNPRQRGRFGERRPTLLRSLHKFCGCMVDSISFLFIRHVSSKNKLYELHASFAQSNLYTRRSTDDTPTRKSSTDSTQLSLFLHSFPLAFPQPFTRTLSHLVAPPSLHPQIHPCLQGHLS